MQYKCLSENYFEPHILIIFHSSGMATPEPDTSGGLVQPSLRFGLAGMTVNKLVGFSLLSELAGAIQNFTFKNSRFLRTRIRLTLNLEPACGRQALNFESEKSLKNFSNQL